MIYEIVLRVETAAPYDLELIHDNPHSALDVVEVLRARLRDADVTILRDDVKITAAELVTDVKSYEIRAVMEEDCQLPSTYRHGRGGDSDLAMGVDGYQHGVWKPKNPEDNYD
jgi:hypothetical protein